MTDFTREDIEKAFIDATADKDEALIAGELHDRFVDFENATGEKEIKNLFYFLIDQIFDDSNKSIRNHWFYRNRETVDVRGNRILAVVCFQLGIFSLNTEDSAENRDESELTTLELDVNKVLGIDLDAQLYQQTVQNVLESVSGDEKRYAEACELTVKTVTWEDTARTKGSSGGRNISDMTLAVEVKDTITGETSSKELPVIRTSNFRDRSADIDPENFNIKVGNAKGDELHDVSLKEALEKPWELMHNPEEWPLKDEDGNNLGVFTDGVDKKVLVSAQACLMPITTKGGEATYKPHIYNYQSHHHPDHGPQPYVMTMMITRQGTSIDICGRKVASKTGRGQALWFNDNGEKAPLTSKRPDALERLEMAQHKAEGRTAQDNADQHNRVLVVQVPLIPKHDRGDPGYLTFFGSPSKGTLYSPLFKTSTLENAQISDCDYTITEIHDGLTATATASASLDKGIPISTNYSSNSFRRKRMTSSGVKRKSSTRELSYTRTRGKSDIEDAVINTGETEGEFNENLSKGWKRDTSCPVRITVQLTKATSNGVIDEAGMKKISKELQDVYQNAARIGSLVVPEAT
jgi:hypothetical protein